MADWFFIAVSNLLSLVNNTQQMVMTALSQHHGPGLCLVHTSRQLRQAFSIEHVNPMPIVAAKEG